MLDHILNHIFRTLLMYVVMYALMRIMGKREIGKLSIFDLIISFMMAEIAVLVLEDLERPLYDGIIPLVVLVVLQIGMAYITLKSRKLRIWFDGKPNVLVQNGKLNREEMASQRYNLDDLMLQLREQQIDDLAKVEFAILETSGKLTVIPKDESNAAGNQGAVQSPNRSKARSKQRLSEKMDIKKRSETVHQFRYEGLPIPLIMDGKVQDDNLQRLGKTRFWLKDQLKQQGYKDFKEVFLCSMDHNGKLFISSGS